MHTEVQITKRESLDMSKNLKWSLQPHLMCMHIFTCRELLCTPIICRFLSQSPAFDAVNDIACRSIHVALVSLECISKPPLHKVFSSSSYGGELAAWISYYSHYCVFFCACVDVSSRRLYARQRHTFQQTQGNPFFKEKELPWVGYEPTTLHFLAMSALSTELYTRAAQQVGGSNLQHNTTQGKSKPKQLCYGTTNSHLVCRSRPG